MQNIDAAHRTLHFTSHVFIHFLLNNMLLQSSFRKESQSSEGGLKSKQEIKIEKKEVIN